MLLAENGLITLKGGAGGAGISLADIASNPRKIRFVELDAAQLPHLLDDVDASVITLNYAVLAGLDPKTALVLENDQSRWHLVWAARKDRADDPRISRFVELYRSPEVRDFILTRFNGTIVPRRRPSSRPEDLMPMIFVALNPGGASASNHAPRRGTSFGAQQRHGRGVQTWPRCGR